MKANPNTTRKAITFYPTVDTAHPLRAIAAYVTSTNKDGSVNLVADDGHDTPYESVPLLPVDAVHPATGRYALAGPPDLDEPAPAVPAKVTRAPAAKKKAKKS